MRKRRKEQGEGREGRSRVREEEGGTERASEGRSSVIKEQGNGRAGRREEEVRQWRQEQAEEEKEETG